MRARVIPAAILLLTAIAGCSLLVDFTDAPPDAGVADFDAQADAPASDSSEDTGPPDPCTGKIDGYNYDPSDTYARCCDASAVRTVTDDQCGACFIKCNIAKGQKCQSAGPHYYCRGCEASTDCWSDCCSLEFGTGLCAASNCATGSCDVAICKDGTHCVVAGDASNYCAY
ncbi:MAG: hypothetical protein ACRELY_18485 [Polyangiaceae bacterium]